GVAILGYPTVQFKKADSFGFEPRPAAIRAKWPKNRRRIRGLCQELWSQEYQVANQPRIDAAQEANRQACITKDPAQIQAARSQLQQVWAGLQPYRVAAVEKIKPLLLPEQVTVLQDPKNQWREKHANEANDPSAN
ncbi:MAG TPA: hypothetical protein VGE85_09585, partial [Terracidiphilus sp.]